jgi:hypothetical protein
MYGISVWKVRAPITGNAAKKFGAVLYTAIAFCANGNAAAKRPNARRAYSRFLHATTAIAVPMINSTSRTTSDQFILITPGIAAHARGAIPAQEASTKFTDFDNRPEQIIPLGIFQVS